MQDRKCGETVIQAPAFNTTVHQDLHMMPGLLRLGTKLSSIAHFIYVFFYKIFYEVGIPFLFYSTATGTLFGLMYMMNRNRSNESYWNLRLALLLNWELEHYIIKYTNNLGTVASIYIILKLSPLNARIRIDLRPRSAYIKQKQIRNNTFRLWLRRLK